MTWSVSRVWVINHLEDDARMALATTKEGHRLGVLRAHPPWHRTPHSLGIRSAINAMVRNRRFALANGADAITVFMDFVESNAKGKFPIHPSYLELKRLLVEHTQFRSSDAEVAAVKSRLKVTEPTAEGAASDVADESTAVATKPVQTPPRSQSPSKATLPPLRKAAN
jgi:hypothetical protein